MKKQHALAILSLFVSFLLTTSSKADSFDDAVNHYLKGFDYCKEAKAHLGSGRLPQAQTALGQYQRLLDEAVNMDATIMTSGKRGMDGNLKYCQRVKRDVEVEVGMPAMNRALAACDDAEQALKDEQPQLATEKLAEYRQLKDQALKQAPSLEDIFTVKNQISRCERIDNKIAAFSKKQKALAVAIETSRTESAAYLASCQKTLETLKSEKPGASAFRDAQQGLASARTHRKNAQGERLAQQEFNRNPQHPAKKTMETNLANGDRCTTELDQLIIAKQQELTQAQQQQARQQKQIMAAPPKPEAAPPAQAPIAATVTAPTPVPVPTPAPAVKAAPVAEVAYKLSGTLRINELTPDFALFYVPDSTQPQTAEIILNRNGFSQPLYVVAKGGSVSIKNRDNTAHRISANNSASGISDTLARLQPRQGRTLSADWPEHSILTLRTDRGTFPGSYLACLPTANYQQIQFNNNVAELAFNNTQDATRFYLVMPDMDLLTFTLNKGETKSLALTRNGTPVGSLLIAGH